MSENVCVDCKYFMGFDGVGELWTSCSIHGDFKVKTTSCKYFEKKVTKSDLLNKLYEENEQLKKEYKIAIDEMVTDYKKLEKENEQLKEQLQMIKRIIQTQIKEKEEDLRISVKGGMPTGGLYSEIGLLKELKKECFDE